jgi:tetratricopeptide (TPR) repeat protein
MKRQQILVAGTGVLLLVVLYFFGNTNPPRKMPDAAAGNGENGPVIKSIGLQDILQASEVHLTPAQLSYVNRLKQSVVRGDVTAQQISADRQLARFWKDSVSDGFLLYAYYTGEVAKLENTEKSLTFAARKFLDALREEDGAGGQGNADSQSAAGGKSGASGEVAGMKRWMATSAKELFEKALLIDPNDDSAKVGLGASYIFGAAAGDPTEVMQGIQQVLEVTRRDSTNMYAQFMLGYGGIESGQYDKAIVRLTTVVRHEPANIEALLLLAGAQQQTGNKAEAVKCYEAARKLIANPDMIRAIEQQIKTLQ